MNVLLACPGIFEQIGGGQRFYANLILNNPAIEFYCGVDRAPAGIVPRNARCLRLTDAHRRQPESFRPDLIPAGSPIEPLRDNAKELAYLLDLAASMPAMSFDVIDVPDFLPLAVYLPECLRYFGVDFARLALSMHGTLSMGLRDNWDANLDDLAALIEHEELLYRCCDIRYGIGRQYIAGWEQAHGLPAQLIDVAKIYRIHDAAPAPSQAPETSGEAPSLCFIGRQEKWKGPDLFLEMCSRLPRDAFADVRMYGPSVVLHGHDSLEELRRLARHRSLDLIHEVIEPEAVAARMREERMVVVLPSRCDPFNLVAVEALLNGCPTVVSTRCGVCDFLDTAYPGLPYVKLDPDDLFGCYDQILALLTNYDAARVALTDYLGGAKPGNYGTTLGPIYAGEPQFDAAAREVISERFGALCDWLEVGFLPAAERNAAADAAARSTAVLSRRRPADAIDTALAETEFARAVDIARIWRQSRPVSDNPAWEAVDAALERLKGHASGGSRVGTYRLLAAWERSRGNDLLYAAYWLRVMRISGTIAAAVFHDIISILTENGYVDAALAAEMLRRGDDDEIHAYLDRRRSLFRAAPDNEVVSRVEIARPEAPRISVIVSVYNNAARINPFAAGLERLTDIEKAAAEFIFVDCASVDDTGRLLQERLKLASGRGIGSLYLRARERETIGRAWNRGIAAARGDYLAFLGIDEMDRPGSLATLAAFLDRRRDVDWVQGNAVAIDVNAAGSYLRDVAAYDRGFDSQHLHHLDRCAISHAGALYRRSIHDLVGLYDDTFRTGADTEFKNRALPFIRVASVPETLGTFLHYPETAAVRSPTAEIEDLPAWDLHRTPGGIRYAFAASDDDDCLGQFRRALHFRPSDEDAPASDVDYAWNVAEYLRRHRPQAFAEIEQFIPNLLGLRLAYRRLDDLADPETCPGAKGFDAIGDALERVCFAIAESTAIHRMLGLPAAYRPDSDNRRHRYDRVWPSSARRAPAGQEALQIQVGAAFELDLSRPIAGTGWYQAEHSDGRWYRWTGPGARFTLEMLLPHEHSYRCEMVIAPALPQVSQDLSVTINDANVAHIEQREDDALHLSFPVMRSLARSDSDFCRIACRHKTVFSPAEAGAADSRRLGFAVRSISFVPLPRTASAAAASQAEAPLDAVVAGEVPSENGAGDLAGLDIPSVDIGSEKLPAVEPTAACWEAPE
jgi:glycosyltransferase involved in cell wall biosynthesis